MKKGNLFLIVLGKSKIKARASGRASVLHHYVAEGQEARGDRDTLILLIRNKIMA